MRKILALLLISIALVSCSQDGDRPMSSDTLPKSNGGVLDIMVVASEGVWQDEAGEVLRKYVTEAQYGLPQPEPWFTLRQVNHKQFNSLLKRVRNLIILDLDSTDFRGQKNYFAKPQLVYHLTAPTEKELAALIVSKQKEMLAEIRQSEIDHLQKRLLVKYQPTHPTLKAHHLNLKIPMDYDLEKYSDNLLVFWKKGLKSDQGILVYIEEIDPTSGVLGERIIPLRDSLTQIHVQGEKEGTYMMVEDILPPRMSNREIDGQFTLETRGLWRTKGDFIGGAFVNYSIFDEINNQRIMLDGFVYAPEQNKRDLLLELEAILQTIEIAN